MADNRIDIIGDVRRVIGPISPDAEVGRGLDLIGAAVGRIHFPSDRIGSAQAWKIGE